MNSITVLLILIFVVIVGFSAWVLLQDLWETREHHP
jgi:hypothetical protein